MPHGRNAYRVHPLGSVPTADRVADGYLRSATQNRHLRRLLAGRFDGYRRAMISFLAASCDQSTEVRATELLRDAHQDMALAASDYELVGYHLLAAAGRYDLPVVTQAVITGAFRRARAGIVRDGSGPVMMLTGSDRALFET